MPEEDIGTKPPEAQPGTLPPGEGDPGKVGIPATDLSGEKPPVDPETGKPAEKPPAEELEFIEKDGVKYYKSFDKHPEWRELKDTKTAMATVLEEHGFNSIEDVVAALQRGNSLADLLGTSDANKVQAILDKADEMDRTKEYWAEKEAERKEKGETDEETIARLKNELKTEKTARRTDATDRETMDSKREQLTTFNKDVGALVDLAEGLGDSEKSMLKLHLGVDNPMDEINIGDRTAVRTTAKDVISNFTDFIKGVRQAAIDDYAAGKSEIVPAVAPTGEEVPAVKKQAVEVKEGTTIEEAVAEANKLVIEQFTNLPE